MEFVLNRLEEGLRDLCVWIVVRAALLVDIRDLQIEAALACPNRTNPLQQLFELVRSELLSLLQAFIVQHKALDDELA